MVRPDILNRTSIAQDAAALWGRAGADLLIDNLIEETALANQALPMLEPTRQVFVDIRPIDPTWRGLNAYMRLEDLMPCYVFDSNSDVLAILDQLQGTGIHESAHRAHYQHMRQQEYNLRTWFGLALREGIAEYAEDAVDDEIFGTNTRFEVEGRDEALDTLIDLLYNQQPAATDKNNYYEFMHGSVGRVGAKGYHAARYAVSLFAAAKRSSLEDLMRTPVEAYQEFVEHEL